MSKGKINVVGYEGKVVYENTTTALRRIEVSKQLLEDIVDFKRDIMKEEFSVTDIRGFKEKGDKFSFQCGVGYNVVEKDLIKGTDGIQARLFETFSTYKKEPTLKNLEILNNSIETLKNRFPQLEKFNGYHNENKKIENNLEDEKIEIFVSKIKKEIIHNFKSNLENVDATVNISDYLQGKDFEEVILDNIEKEISDFPLTNEEVIGKYKLKDELPVIKIFTESGLAYSSDNSRTDEYAEKELYQKLETYKYAQGKRPDFNDIKEIAELVNFDKISNVKDGMQLYYENNYGDLKEYTDYDDYTDELVKEVLISKLYDKVEPLKKEIESIIEMRKNPVEIYSNEYIKEGNLENLENKYKEIVEKLEQKEEPTKQNEELEKENKKDKEREF
jgi:putative tetratricopeptide repeat-containing protein